jgi:hypothetical protein
MVFRIENGAAVGIDNPEGDGYWEDDSEEPLGCADGWYWQHRRIREFEAMSTAMGALRGPFAMTAAEEEDVVMNSREMGVDRL